MPVLCFGLLSLSEVFADYGLVNEFFFEFSEP